MNKRNRFHHARCGVHPWLLPVLGALILLGGCGSKQNPSPQSKPNILLITLDTTRDDRMGDRLERGQTPNIVAWASRGIRFTQAYTTAPFTLPAHTSILSGLYPIEHGIHENTNYLSPDLELITDLLKEKGYQTAAFVSATPLTGEFGLSRAFDHYNDSFESSERKAGETVDHALGHLASSSDEPLFMWVHLYDPHHPYEPPPPFSETFADDPYLGEMAYMDAQAGRLLNAFEQHKGGDHPYKVIIAGDHGEGLGDHGEDYHGYLLYQSVIHVPLMIAGSGIQPAIREDVVSIRHIYDTIAGFAGGDGRSSLMSEHREPVVASAMKPYLQFGWHPQVAVIDDTTKIIRSGDLEVFKIDIDRHEENNIAQEVTLDKKLIAIIEQHIDPSRNLEQAQLTEEELERLASLGYAKSLGISQSSQPRPIPREMTELFEPIGDGLRLLNEDQFEAALKLFRNILDRDPNNLAVLIHSAVCYSKTNQPRRATDAFHKASTLSPDSIELKHYWAKHHFRYEEWEDSATLFQQILETTPNHLPSLEHLSMILEQHQQWEPAADLTKRAISIRTHSGLFLQEVSRADQMYARLGVLRHLAGQHQEAIRALEKAQELSDSFDQHLALGISYYAQRRYQQASQTLNLIGTSHPQYAVALYYGAAALLRLGDADSQSRAKLALRHATPQTMALMREDPAFSTLLETTTQ